jgi:hypothetical protein
VRFHTLRHLAKLIALRITTEGRAMSRWHDITEERNALLARAADNERRIRAIAERVRDRDCITRRERDMIAVLILDTAACQRLAENMRIPH